MDRSLARPARRGKGGAEAAQRPFVYSSQEHILLIRCDKARCELRALNPVGEVFDAVSDLR